MVKNRSPIKYADIVDVEKLQMLLESFSQTIGVANSVVDTNGGVIASAGWQDVCTKFHRVNAESCRNCIASDTSLANSMADRVPFAIYDCLNGLTDAAAPIIIDGWHLANVLTGQFFTEPPDLDFFRQQARQFGFDECSYLAAIEKVPVLSRERIESISRLYIQLAELLASNGLDRMIQLDSTRQLAEVSERVLIEREAQFRRAIEASLDGYWMSDLDGRILEVNDAYVKVSGYSREELLSMRVADIEVAETTDTISNHMGKIIKFGFDTFESRHRKKDGQIWSAQVTSSYLYSSEGRMFVFMRDLSRQKEDEQRLQFTQFVMDQADVEIYWLDRNARVHYVNRKVCETLGYTREELMALSIPEINPTFPVEKWEEHWQSLCREKVLQFETVHQRKDGTQFPIEVHANYVKFGEFEYNVAFTRDISERKVFEKILTEQACEDYLTGLSNRRHFSEMVEAELLRSARYDSPLSVLLLDVDKFKLVNDTHGHKVGDMVLQALASTCRETLREVDLIGRWGGEEFAVLLPETTSNTAAEVADRLRVALSKVAISLVDGNVLHFTVSIGCATRNCESNSLEALFLHADKALYQAKGAGRNRIVVAAQ